MQPSYKASIMATRPRPAPTETPTAMLAAAPVAVADGEASVPEALTSESEPDSVASPEVEPEVDAAPDPAVNSISLIYFVSTG